METMSITRRQAALASLGLFATGAQRARASSVKVKALRIPYGGIQPQLVAGPRGLLHLVYYSGDPRGGDLFYVRSTDGASTWSMPIPVNKPGSAIAAGTIRGAQLAVSNSGRVHVVWNGSSKAQLRGPLNPDSGKPGEPMLYTRLNDVGDAFESERNLMTQSFGLDGGGSVAAGDGGDVYVTWHGIGSRDERNRSEGEARRQVWVAVSRDAGKTFRPEQKAWQEPTGACGCCGMKAFADRHGHVHALYRSARESVNRDVYWLRSTDRGATFTGKLLHEWDINACPMSSMDFTERNGTLVAAWETGGQVYWAQLGRKSEQANPVAAPGEGKGRKHPRIVANSKGELLLVWTEGTGWQRGGSLAWQVYDADGKPASDSGIVAAGAPVWSFAAPMAHADGTFSILY
jgi:hypothetical protein